MTPAMEAGVSGHVWEHRRNCRADGLIYNRSFEAALSNTMSWFWIALALSLPFAVAVLVAWPFWGRSRDSLGSGVGSIFIFSCAVEFIAREYVELQQFSRECIVTEKVCSFHPEPFTRFCVYAFIGMAQVGTLFAISGAVERRIENAAFAKEWRR
jgi:hypothetical protein